LTNKKARQVPEDDMQAQAKSMAFKLISARLSLESKGITTTTENVLKEIAEQDKNKH
jgi:hypothetical protein